MIAFTYHLNLVEQPQAALNRHTVYSDEETRADDPMRDNKPTLRQLEYFVAVAENQTFRRAAERLGISQPTLTAQIHALEDTLNAKVFERSRTGAVLSPIGRDLLLNARRVIEEVAGLMETADIAKHGPGGTYRLGVSPTLGPYLLPHILPELHHKFSSLKFYVRESLPRDLEQELIEGKLDLILTPLPLTSSKLTVAPLFREPLRLVLPADHKLADRDNIKGHELRDENVLTLEEKYHHYRQVEALCDELGANVLRDYEGTSLDALRQMVVMGMGVAFLPELYIHSEIHRPEELVVSRIADIQLSRTHALVWRPGSPNRVFFRQLTELLKNMIKENLKEANLQVQDFLK